MNLKNEATIKSCKDWKMYPFENNHYLKDERLYDFIHHLCEFEDKVEKKDFKSLTKDAECKRTDEEINTAFKKYEIIYDFYQYLKEKGLC